MLEKEVSTYITSEDGIHQLAVYERGNPNGPAVIVLHGGPGASIANEYFDFFDLEYWHVIAFDQRGCGNSKPFGSMQNNLVADGVQDIETIRHYYGIEHWVVFGGSYGSTLALCYGIQHASIVDAFVLRGIYLARQKDTDWLFAEGGASKFYPDEFEKFVDVIPVSKRDHLMEAYYEIFCSDDEEQKKLACKAWTNWENALVRLQKQPPTETITKFDISCALLECHFMIHHMGWNDDNYILNHSDSIADIPTYIVQGRYDVDCVPEQAWLLKKKLNQVKEFHLNCCGHSCFEEENKNSLTNIMKELQK